MGGKIKNAHPRIWHSKNLHLIFLILFILFIPLSFSAINVTNVLTEITLNKDGTATVQEKISIFISNELDIVDYNKAAEKNNIQAWQQLLNNDEVRLHVDLSKVQLIGDIKISPQPIKSTIQGFSGVIIINYRVSGLFEEKVIKPRVMSYKLNSNALSFKKTDAGNLILKNNVLLQINLPDNVYVSDINPLPSNIKSESDLINAKSFYWRDIIMVDPKLEVILEQPISEEINAFFESLVSYIFSLTAKQETLIYVALIIVLVFLYIYIISNIKGWKYGISKK
ncbi:MAG: hypothetical protein QXI89_01505 [Candidatus Anstonellales archaeon]